METTHADAHGATAKHSHPQPKKADWRWIALAVILVVGGGASVRYWLWSQAHETTDDAFVDADVAAVNSKVRGQVTKIEFKDNQMVNQGDALLEIDPTDYRVRRDQTKAELAAAQAQAHRAQTDAARYKQLFEADQVSRQVYDHAVAEAEVSKANVDVAQQKLAQAELDLSYTHITAPVSGRATRRSVEEKSFVEVGQPLMAVVPSEIYVTANFKETQLTHMRPGQTVEISVDTYASHHFKAHIDSIQAGTGARFSLMPPENATGNFVKVVQRVPVKIVFDEPTSDYLLAPGMSVEPTVELK
jgi:membrane fusion protein (multidrug efflux system)